MNSQRKNVSYWIPKMLFICCSWITVCVYKPSNCGTSSLFLCIDELLVRAQLCKLFCKIISQSFFSVLWINKLLSELFWASGQIEKVLSDSLTWFRIIINCLSKLLIQYLYDSIYSFTSFYKLKKCLTKDILNHNISALK